MVFLRGFQKYLLQNFSQIMRNGKKTHKALFRIQKSHQTLNSINDGICIRIYLKSL